MSPFIKKILMNVTAPLLVLGLLEIGLALGGAHLEKKTKKQLFRIFNKENSPLDPTINPKIEKDDLLFWRLKPGSGESINARGMRGPLREYLKPAKTYRIILMGDSCAYGMFVSYEKTYASLLENILREKTGCRIEVFNAGVPGYSSLQGLRYLKKELFKYQPDLLIVAFGFNDLVSIVDLEDKNIPALPAWFVSFDNALSNTRLYRLLKKSLASIHVHTNSNQPTSVPPLALDRDEVPIALESIEDLKTQVDTFNQQLLLLCRRRVHPQDFLDNMRSISKLASQHRARTVFLTLPAMEFEFGYGPLLRLWSRKEKTELLDMEKKFTERNARTQEYFFDNTHYNESGHRLVAELLAERILPIIVEKSFSSK